MAILQNVLDLVEGLTEDDFDHIPTASRYNGNYYQLGDYLFYAQSDDDDSTTWYLIRPTTSNVIVGMSFCGLGDVIMTDECYRA